MSHAKAQFSRMIFGQAFNMENTDKNYNPGQWNWWIHPGKNDFFFKISSHQTLQTEPQNYNYTKDLGLYTLHPCKSAQDPGIKMIKIMPQSVQLQQ